MVKIISKLTIIYVCVACFLSCTYREKKLQKFTALFSTNSSIESKYGSGVYNVDSLHLVFFAKEASSMLCIYNNDTLRTYNDSIDLKISTIPLRLSLIPTAFRAYKKYSNSWHRPKGQLSSFHSIKILCYSDSILTDSLTCNYVLGAIERDQLTVVNLRVNEQLLFDDKTGSYVPGTSFDENDEYNSGNYYLFKRRKQLSKIQIIDSISEYLNDSILFRTHGYITPLAPQKSLRFYNNGNSKLSNWIGINHVMDKFILRSSYSGWQSEIFVDGWIADVCSGLNFDVMAYKPVKVYLNGEYWGIHGFRERLDLNAISNKYGLKSKKIIDADDKGFSEIEGYGDLNTLLKAIQSDSVVSYKSVRKKFKMKSLVDWIIVELFFQNTDWPCNNTFFWKKKKKSGEWRAVLIDMDACVGNPKFNMFDFATKDRSPLLGGELVTFLLNQPDFQKLFKNRVAHLLDNDLSQEMLKEKLYHYQMLFEPAVKEHFNRWNPKSGLSEYKKAIKRLNDFCNKRQRYFLQNMNQYFEKK